MINDHVDHRMASASNGQEETEPQVKDFVDVLLEVAETNSRDTKIGRETIKSLIFVCLYDFNHFNSIPIFKLERFH